MHFIANILQISGLQAQLTLISICYLKSFQPNTHVSNRNYIWNRWRIEQSENRGWSAVRSLAHIYNMLYVSSYVCLCLMYTINFLRWQSAMANINFTFANNNVDDDNDNNNSNNNKLRVYMYKILLNICTLMH